MKQAFTMHEVADTIGVSYQSVRKLVRDGKMRHAHVGSVVVIAQRHLDTFLDGNAGEFACSTCRPSTRSGASA